MHPGLTVTSSSEGDVAALCRVHRRAFGASEGEVIVHLVEALLQDMSARPLLSLVARRDGAILGHVLFTNTEVVGAGESLSARLLAPLGVLPECQRAGIGSALAREGLRLLAAEGVDLVFVLGDPAYYGRFGFAAAARRFAPPHPLPEAYREAWMVAELTSRPARETGGQVRCAAAIADPRYWRE